MSQEKNPACAAQALFSEDLLSRPRAKWLQVEVDAIFGAQDQLGDLNGDLGRVRREFKAQQTKGCDHLQLVHGKLLPDAIPAASNKETSSSCWLTRVTEPRVLRGPPKTITSFGHIMAS